MPTLTLTSTVSLTPSRIPGTARKSARRKNTARVESALCPPCAAEHRAQKPRWRRRIARPDPDSLFDIMRQHAGTSLFVRPICWTDLHSQLLGARFVELPRCDTPLPPRSPNGAAMPSRCHMQPSEKASTLSRELDAMLSLNPLQPFFHVQSIRTILSTLYPETLSQPKTLPELNIYFGGRIYRDAVRVQLMWNYPTGQGSFVSFNSTTTRPADSFYGEESDPSSSRSSGVQASLPMLAYIGRSQLAAVRKNLFRVIPGPGRTFNAPVSSLQQLRAKMLIPANIDHDAHFLGIFLAMAQKHFYSDDYSESRIFEGSQANGAPDFHDVTVQILTHDIESADFIIYTAVVSSAVLKLFHSPIRVPKDDARSGIDITFCKVPIWPILGLKERLGKALGRDIVGDFDEDDIEMWEEGPTQSGSLKRKERGARGALSEMMNRSFGEESEEESSPSPSKRRCLTNDGKEVGVVT